MPDSNSLLGIGLYSVAESARMLRVPAKTVRRWVEGYTFTTRGRTGQSDPVFSTQLQRAHDDQIITFADLIELHFVAMFRKNGVSMQRIRQAAAQLARRFNTSHPFAVQRLDTDGRSIFATLQAEWAGGASKQVIEELHRMQLVFSEFAPLYFQKIDYRPEDAGCFWPLGRDGRVVLDRERSFGKPIDHQTGVRTLSLYRASLSGDSLRSIAAWYRVPIAAIHKSIEYELSLRSAA